MSFTASDATGAVGWCIDLVRATTGTNRSRSGVSKTSISTHQNCESSRPVLRDTYAPNGYPLRSIADGYLSLALAAGPSGSDGDFDCSVGLSRTA